MSRKRVKAFAKRCVFERLRCRRRRANVGLGQEGIPFGLSQKCGELSYASQMIAYYAQFVIGRAVFSKDSSAIFID